ncbi:DUF4167 domain-containing protein [Roseibium litorale]|uniref:DUF4167 domain-containing protein n=1 Tax=Roseibium litorale TaxID=2803841 RepID=A0ABR9CM78_9HYPH|nr:DUF4167 domain-containing protein [Roseibium litorale]MBD8891968.1 DUF4167 domain-containing protein [Roseibium litorale]
MRPGNQSKQQRMRGRSRKGPNPLSRTYESNGPDVKIRGTALHVAEKYQQLARDAQASGDRIMSENYFQHAEHYLRIVAAAQGNMQPVLQSSLGEDEDGQDYPAQTVSENRERFERPERFDRNGGDRPERAERQERRERPDRPERVERAERQPRHDRGDSGERFTQPDMVGEDSPQPFIDDMPLIDASGQVNGHAARAGDESGEDDKPRRRPRGTRGRGVRRNDAEDGATAAAEAAAPVEQVEAVAADEDAPAKPKPRRTPRPRKPKAEEGAPKEVAAAGE